MSLAMLAQSIQGPILIVGANDFAGWNFFVKLQSLRSDIHGLCSRPNWRTQSLNLQDLHFESQGASFKDLLIKIKPALIIDLESYGAYASQKNVESIFATNVLRLARNLEDLSESSLRSMYLHAGSYAEYGEQADLATEDRLSPHSLFAVSKASAAQLISYYGHHRGLACAHLRLFSLYGPYDEPGRLITEMCRSGIRKKWSALGHAKNGRDFLFVDDALSAFLSVALHLNKHPELKAEYFNIGSGHELKLREVAFVAGELFDIPGEAPFGEYLDKSFEVKSWSANTDKLKKLTRWEPEYGFEEGLKICKDWWMNHPQLTPLPETYRKPMLSVVVAVYKDERSLEELYNEVVLTSVRHGFDFELIFVNDGSPDQSENKIIELSLRDLRVQGINHTKNFGNQAAFWSGLEAAVGDAVILMDGDLQDPPSVIGEMFDVWTRKNQKQAAGYFPMVVGARRSSREMFLPLIWAHRLFYRISNLLSGTKMPTDVGDFSLMDRRVVDELLKHQDQQLWIRGIRAQLAFPTSYVNYHRPRRKYGKSTSHFFKLVSWAYKGIFGFSGEPLRLWKKPVLLLAAVTCAVGFSSDSVDKANLGLLLLILASLLMIADLMVLLYRQSLGRPRKIVLSQIVDGEVRAPQQHSEL